MQPDRGSVAPVLVAGASTALTAAALGIGLAAAGLERTLTSYALSSSVIGLAFALIGALVIRADAHNAIGYLFAGAGLWAGIGGLSLALIAVTQEGSSLQPILIFVQAIWTPSVFLFLLIPHLYPDGRLMSRRWRVPFAVAVAAAVVSTLALVLSRHVFDEYPGLTSPLVVPVPDPVMTSLAVGGALVVVLMALTAVVGQVLRMRRVEGDERARIAWLVAAVILMIVAFVGPSPAVALVIEVLGIGCLGLGIVRYRLFDIQAVLSRGLVYGLVVVAASLAALGAAALLGSASDVGPLPAVAAAVTALALAAVVGRLTSWVDRLLFGARSDPGRALATLGTRLAEAPEPDDVLPTVVDTLRESLRLPYAAVTLEGEDEPAASSGERPDRCIAFPLLYGGREVGSLELGQRRGEGTLSPSDDRLVATFAAQAGAAAHGAQVTRDLRRSRESLVFAREEERRVMRRELHDGVGPTLAGIALGLESVRRAAINDDQQRLASDLLDQAHQGLQEVRTLARDLRPAALDELGLAAAVRQHAQTVGRMTGGHPDVAVTIPADLPELPAAVEVAAYRIVQEGVTNATRHADASLCSVEISANGSLVVRVVDDGCGRTPAEAGAGLRSMRERAEELGGECAVTFTPGLGTTVHAVLPLPGAGLAAASGRGGSAP